MVLTETELNKEEFYTLLESAPEEESDILIRYTKQIGTTPWEYFQQFGLYFYGILRGTVPIYFACIYAGEEDSYNVWTLRNRNIKEQFSLFKLVKRRLNKIEKQFNPIYAANYVKNKLEAKWNMRLGFLPFMVEGDMVYYKMGG